MKAILSFASLATLCLPLLAGEPQKTVLEPAPQDPRILFRATSSYLFESDFIRGNNAKGDALHNEINFGYRIPLNLDLPTRSGGAWYLNLGARYGRMDFDNSGNLPLPTTLQSAAAVLRVEYLERGQIGFLFETRPGVYFEHEVYSSSFDAPTTLGISIPITDSFYGIVGVNTSILRRYPVIPALGFFWKPSPKWSILASAPEPRITYQYSDKLAFFAGGELTGGAFTVDGNNRQTALNRAVVTYSEYRAGAGLTWSSRNCALEIGGGYAFNRKFDYYRAEEGFESDQGAPYIRAEMRCAF